MEECIFKKLNSKLEDTSESKTNSFNLLYFINEYLKKNKHLSLTHNLIILDRLEFKATHFTNERPDCQSDKKFKYCKLINYFLDVLQTKKNKKRYKHNYVEHLTFNLNVLMLYAVNKSFKQYKIFQLNYEEDYRIVNNEMFSDEISVIEL